MARMNGGPKVTNAEVDQFLQGRFLETMRLYADMAGTPNPATRAAAGLQRGEAVEVPGEWIGPDSYGLRLRLQKGHPAEVVDEPRPEDVQEPTVATQPMNPPEVVQP